MSRSLCIGLWSRVCVCGLCSCESSGLSWRSVASLRRAIPHGPKFPACMKLRNSFLSSAALAPLTPFLHLKRKKAMSAELHAPKAVPRKQSVNTDGAGVPHLLPHTSLLSLAARAAIAWAPAAPAPVRRNAARRNAVRLRPSLRSGHLRL